MTWWEERFAPSATRVASACLACDRPMWLPPSKVALYRTCDQACRQALVTKRKADRTRPCATCGASFTPRAAQLRAGQGLFCSQKCNTKSHDAMNANDAQERAKASFLASIAAGTYVPARGDQAPRWKGGTKAIRRRLIESGVFAERVRDYRRRNPEKVREFAKKRRGAKVGRLPRGTVRRIGEAQRWRCAACRKPIRDAFHVDHIEPLALGGKHEPKNIQLLCPPCNVRKSAKDPIRFMQERGFLL